MIWRTILGHVLRVFWFVAILISFAALGEAEVEQQAKLPVTMTGSVNFRYEDLNTVSTVERRQERLRMIARLDAQVRFMENGNLLVGGRTGDKNNQQTSTITLVDLNDTSGLGNRSVFLDTWALRYARSGGTLQLGRTPWPFWSVSESVWDRDIHPAGAMGLIAPQQGPLSGYQLAAALYRLPDGAVHFTGTLFTAQVMRQVRLNGGTLRTALQWFAMNGGSEARFPLGQPNLRDYSIGLFSVQYRWQVQSTPVAAGIDVFHNFENYGPQDAFAYAHKDRDTGFALGLSLGQNLSKGDWQLRYAFTYQEMLSVNPATSDDLISSLGLTNYRAHDFRLIYSLLRHTTLGLRFTTAEQLIGQAKANRWRVDLVHRF